MIEPILRIAYCIPTLCLLLQSIHRATTTSAYYEVWIFNQVNDPCGSAQVRYEILNQDGNVFKDFIVDTTNVRDGELWIELDVELEVNFAFQSSGAVSRVSLADESLLVPASLRVTVISTSNDKPTIWGLDSV